MFFDGRQLAISILALFLTSAATAAMVFAREGDRRAVRRWGFVIIAICAMLGLESWTRFGDMHSIFVDADYSDLAPNRRKEERHRPFHFHEFFHYYLASKYFKELGYESLYDCVTDADHEIANEDHVRPRITGYIRNLSDVLTDKTIEEAVAHCEGDRRKHFTDERWAAFKDDMRELHHLVPDDWWGGAVYDAGFNPPPTWCVVGSFFSNVIPIRIGASFPGYLVATSLDTILLVLCFFGIRRAFGNIAAVLAAMYFGASFISSYGWNGGAFLRFTWVAGVILGLAAAKREKWVLAGALLGAAACDRLFPAAFGAGVMIPFIYRVARARLSPQAGDVSADLAVMKKFGAGFVGTCLALFVTSLAVFGLGEWGIFFSRILKHGDIYYVMHIGLKKVLTFRDWVPNQNFHDHAGLANFKSWNLRLRELWASMRPVVVPLQLLVVAGVAYAGIRRRPYEAGLLAGACGMFFFNLPANYYYVILIMVPVLLFHAAATTPSSEARLREYVALTLFNAFWMCTFFASRAVNDAIIYDYYICVALLVFLVAWIATWIGTPARYPLKTVACQTDQPPPSSTASAVSSAE
jgi:hypothetical protein